MNDVVLYGSEADGGEVALDELRNHNEAARRTNQKPSKDFPKERRLVEVVVATDVVAEDVLFGGFLDGIGDEAEDGPDPEQHGEAAEEVLAELDPLGRHLGRRQRVGTVALQVGPRLTRRQTLFQQTHRNPSNPANNSAPHPPHPTEY